MHRRKSTNTLTKEQLHVILHSKEVWQHLSLCPLRTPFVMAMECYYRVCLCPLPYARRGRELYMLLGY